MDDFYDFLYEAPTAAQTYSQPAQEPAAGRHLKATKKRSGAAGIVALALCCSLVGGAMGAGRQINSVTGETGYATTVKAYPGDTLSEQAANALMDICGISQETLEKIREILVETY